MKEIIIPLLICPACLPGENPLEVDVRRRDGDDIITGDLTCVKCRARYPVIDGIAYLLREHDRHPAGGQSRYEDAELLNRYLWSHYGDLAGVEETAEANSDWARCLVTDGADTFEAGCAVGRLSFEAAARGGLVVGCDLSRSFIQAARRLSRERRCTFSLPLEGALRETFTFELPSQWDTGKLEFIVADALAVPFARGVFRQVSSLNLLDRVRYPLAHLYEMNRIARPQTASFLLADPFSWSVDAAPEERWLGGTAHGRYAGRGLDNVRALLTGRDSVLTPAWQIVREGAVSWALRTHRNHRELIRSEYLLAGR